MKETLRYALGRPRPSWRLAIPFALAAAAFLFLAAQLAWTMLGMDRQFRAEFPELWTIAAIQLLFGAASLWMAWGSSRRRPWAASLPLPRAGWVALLAFVLFQWARTLPA